MEIMTDLLTSARVICISHASFGIWTIRCSTEQTIGSHLKSKVTFGEIDVSIVPCSIGDRNLVPLEIRNQVLERLCKAEEPLHSSTSPISDSDDAKSTVDLLLPLLKDVCTLSRNKLSSRRNLELILQVNLHEFRGYVLIPLSTRISST